MPRCAKCGTRFKKTHGPQKYCRAHRWDAELKHLGGEMSCARCRRTFRRGHGRQIYCSRECRLAVKREALIENAERYNRNKVYLAEHLAWRKIGQTVARGREREIGDSGLSIVSLGTLLMPAFIVQMAGRKPRIEKWQELQALT